MSLAGFFVGDGDLTLEPIGGFSEGAAAGIVGFVIIYLWNEDW